MKISAIGVVVYVLCVLPSVGQCAVVTVGITAVVDAVNWIDGWPAPSGDPFAGNINVGDTVSGFYRYSSLTQDIHPAAYIGDYEHDEAPYGMFLNIGSIDFQTDPCSIHMLMQIIDDEPDFGYDSFAVASDRIVSHSPLIADLLDASLVLKDDSGNALTSINLPTGPPVLADWGTRRSLSIAGSIMDPAGVPGFEERYFDIVSHVTSLTLVPEPCITSILALGSIAVLARRNRRQRK